MLALDCVRRGELALDAALSDSWPEIRRLDPELTARSCLCHRAGVPAVRRRLAPDEIYDWDAMCQALVDQEPYWRPGTAHGYHVNTFGFLVGEILRRATGIHVKELLRLRASSPLQADFHFGIPPEAHGRVSRLLMEERQLTNPTEFALVFPPSGDRQHDEMIWSAYFNPPGFSGLGTVNRPEWRTATIPSTNSHGNARGIARLFTALCGASEIPRSLIEEAAAVQSDGHDLVLGKPSRYGLGFQLPGSGRSFGPSPTAFGHYGYGGSLGLADPVHRIAFGYCTNKPGDRFDTGRTGAILAALYAAA
jgi:CubicO group peptidase (beta-lactamase class C family)